MERLSRSATTGVSAGTDGDQSREEPKSDKITLLRDADEAFAELHRTIDGLSDEEMRRVWLGTWGVREILIHIAGWHEELTPALGRIGKGEAPYSPGMYDDFDAWNARFVERKARVKSADVPPGAGGRGQATRDGPAAPPRAAPLPARRGNGVAGTPGWRPPGPPKVQDIFLALYRDFPDPGESAGTT